MAIDGPDKNSMSQNQETPTLDYGRSNHYLGEKGQEYFAVQNRGGAALGQLNLWKFAPWIRPSDSVLDFGCGGGWLLSCLNAVGKCGVELNPAARQVCQERNLEVYREVSEIPAGRRFSRIITHHCLEHVPFPVAALKSLRALLNDDGLMIIVVPIDDWRVQQDFTGADPDHHLHTWSPRLFANTLMESGLECKKVDILTHACPYKWETLYRILPRWSFELSCCFWGWAKKRRQLRAIAHIASGNCLRS